MHETDRLGGQAVEQALIPGHAPLSESVRGIARLAKEREWRRGANLPAGGLFDAVERSQQDLF